MLPQRMLCVGRLILNSLAILKPTSQTLSSPWLGTARRMFSIPLPLNISVVVRVVLRMAGDFTLLPIAKLQKKYDQFKTLATLHTDGDGLYAYIGKKEGVGSGDKYAVLEQVMDKDGKVTFDKVGTIKVSKGKVWDNRAGAGETIEGAATGQEDGDTDPTLTSTRFDGKAGKFMDGMLLRQEK